jgi:lactobin A/cerein 7B family class IIb bacteriocin
MENKMMDDLLPVTALNEGELEGVSGGSWPLALLAVGVAAASFDATTEVIRYYRHHTPEQKVIE